MRRRLRFAVMSMYLATGAILLQVGPVCSIASSVGTAGAASGGLFVDENGNLFGLPGVNVCGVPNFSIIDDTTGLGGEVLNTEDDLVVGCPFTFEDEIDMTDGGG